MPWCNRFECDKITCCRVLVIGKCYLEKLYSISYGKNARYFLHFVKTINLKYSMYFFLLPVSGYDNLICLINFGMKAAWRETV